MGYTCRSRDTGHVVEAQEHARRLDDRSRRGENRLVVDLGRAGYPPNLYRTEEQVTEDGETKATPDILFNDLQTIGGKQVRWIDAKSACVIPGVTPERVITALRAQVEKYVREFGPGDTLDEMWILQRRFVWRGRGFTLPSERELAWTAAEGTIGGTVSQFRT